MNYLKAMVISSAIVAIAPTGFAWTQNPDKSKIAEFSVQHNLIGSSSNSSGYGTTLVLNSDGICDLKPRPINDKLLREVLSIRTTRNGIKVCEIYLSILDDSSEKLTFASFAAAIERMRLLRDPAVPTYIFVFYTKVR